MRHRTAFVARDLDTLFRHGQLSELAARCREKVCVLQSREKGSALDIAWALEELACAYYELGYYAAAAERHEEVLSIVAVTLGEVSEPYATNLANLGRTLIFMERLDDAETCLKQALSIVQRLPEEERQGYAAALIIFALLQIERREYVTAQRLLVEAGKRRLREYGSQHPRFGVVFYHFGHLYRRMGQPSAAERAIRKAIRIYRNASHTENADYGRMLASLGVLVGDQGHAADATTYFSEAIAILRRVRPDARDEISKFEDGLARLGDVAGT